MENIFIAAAISFIGEARVIGTLHFIITVFESICQLIFRKCLENASVDLAYSFSYDFVWECGSCYLFPTL